MSDEPWASRNVARRHSSPLGGMGNLYIKWWERKGRLWHNSLRFSRLPRPHHERLAAPVYSPSLVSFLGSPLMDYSERSSTGAWVSGTRRRSRTSTSAS